MGEKSTMIFGSKVRVEPIYKENNVSIQFTGLFLVTGLGTKYDGDLRMNDELKLGEGLTQQVKSTSSKDQHYIYDNEVLEYYR